MDDDLGDHADHLALIQVTADQAQRVVLIGQGVAVDQVGDNDIVVALDTQAVEADGVAIAGDYVNGVASIRQGVVIGRAFVLDLVIHKANQSPEWDADPFLGFVICPGDAVAVGSGAGFEGGAVHILGQGAFQVQDPVLADRAKL